MNRVLAAGRMQLVHPVQSIGIPVAIVASSFAINLVIWALGDVGEAQGGHGATGGLASLYITVAVVFIQAVTQMFPFALGLSLSRRDFYLGTALAAVVQSIGYALALTVLAAIENSTDGWGVGLDFWAPGALDVGNPVLQFVVYAVPMLAMAFLGIGIGVVFKRWGATGIFALTLGTLLIGGLAAIWATWQGAWADVWHWLVDRSVAQLTVGLPAVLIVVVAGLAFLGLRRAVP